MIPIFSNVIDKNVESLGTLTVGKAVNGQVPEGADQSNHFGSELNLASHMTQQLCS